MAKEDSQLFKLSAELIGHTADVRSVLALPDGRLVTGSRDTHIRVWAYDETTKPPSYATETTLFGHEHYVSALFQADGRLISGGNDKKALVWQVSDIKAGVTVKPVVQVTSHTGPVVALAFDASGNIVTGSWDAEIHVTHKTSGKQVAVLKGHKAAVWAVLLLDSGDLISASADRTIKIWRGGNAVRTLTAHTDCVRALAPVPGIGFVSAANDAALRLWSANGDDLQELVGHENYVYSVAVASGTGELVSGGEDKAVRVWRDNNAVQTLLHPGVVWSVTVAANGDILSGSSDGVARVWSRNAARQMTAEALQAYEAHLASTQISSKTVAGMERGKVPGIETLTQPGDKDGQVKVVMNGTQAEAHSWSAAEKRWVKVGDVVDPPGKTLGEQTIGDKTYDMVFDVDLGDGQPTRKLGYNRGQNPYEAAQHFIWDNDINQDYLQQIAEFITANAGDATQPIAPIAAADPLTGGGAYRPTYGTPGQTAHPSTMAPDVSRSHRSPSSSGRGKSQSPLRGSSVRGGGKWVPRRSMVLFEQGNYPGIMKKLDEFNSSLAAAGNTMALSEREFAHVRSITDKLQATSMWHSTTFSDDELRAMQRLMTWPVENRFPALDLARLLILHPDAAAQFIATSKRPNGFNLVQAVLGSGIDVSKTVPTMLILRFIANCFSRSSLAAWLLVSQDSILDSLADLVPAEKTNVRLTLATVLLNLAVHFGANPSHEGKTQVASVLSELMASEKDPDVLLRALTALGTLVFQDKAIQELADTLDLTRTVASYAKHSNADVKACSAEVTSALGP